MRDQKDIEFYGIRRRTEDEPAYFDAKHISVRDLVQLCRSEITASVSSFICATTRRGGMENCREVAQASTERLVSRQKERPYDFSPLETIAIRRETSMIAPPSLLTPVSSANKFLLNHYERTQILGTGEKKKR